LKTIRGKQKGYGIIELVMVLAISAILAVGISSFTIQSITETSRSNIHLQETQQLENAGFWFSRDVQMSQNVTTGVNAGFPLQLYWEDISHNTHLVTYNIMENQIQSTYVENGGPPQQMLVAQLINSAPSLTSCNYTDGMLNLKLTASIGESSFTRTYQIKQRPGSI
jgi:prepilin-type N-terminal cleavage/methylation domain-containing protein